MSGVPARKINIFLGTILFASTIHNWFVINIFKQYEILMPFYTICTINYTFLGHS